MRIKRTRLTRLPHVICSEAPKADPCRPAISFADERTINAAAHLGLAHDSAEALAEQIKQLLPTKDATAERKQFTKIVDALVASDLEHKGGAACPRLIPGLWVAVGCGCGVLSRMRATWR